MGENITVIAENRNLRTLPFIPTDDQLTTGNKWEEWVEGIEREFRYFRITEPIDKKDAMIIYVGKEIARLEKSLPNPTTGDLNEYTTLKKKLDEYFAPKKNKHYARYVFLKMRPTAGETTVAYAARLREKVIDCEFENQEDRILEHIIQTTDNQSLIKKTINKKWTLTEMLQEVHTIEETTLQANGMRDDDIHGDLAKISNGNSNTRHNRKYNDSRYEEERQLHKNRKCRYCGNFHSFNTREECRAYGKQCNKCKGWNHFSVVCKSRSKRNTTGYYEKDSYKKRHSKRRQGRDVRKTLRRGSDDEYTGSSDDEYTGSSDDEYTGSSDDEFYGNAVHHLKDVRKIQIKKINDYTKTVPVLLDDVQVRVEPDSGADVNVMDEYQYRAYKNRTREHTSLQKNSTKLSILQNKLPVKGEFFTTVRNKTRGVKTKIVVVKGKINSPPLLGKRTLTELGMLQITAVGSLKQTNDVRIKEEEHVKSVNEKSQAPGIETILSKSKDIFHGIGKLTDKKKNDDIIVKFSMKPDAIPVAQKPRPVPYYLQAPLKDWLDQGVQEDIFEHVEPGEPIIWCSPLVVQPKPRFSQIEKDSLEPHMIRASVDLRVPNNYMERNRSTQTPVVEDFTYKFHDCTVFSEMDMKQGYHQLILHPDSRAVATFSTPWGNMRPKKLIFGAKSSQDLFDEAMYRRS